MITLFSKHALCIISLLCYSVGTDAIEVATTMPKKVENIIKKANITEIKGFLNNTRRIIIGTESKENRPYMVYLKLPANNPKYKDYRRWLCGGVIIHEEYILTSAACIEDAKHFYIVSGTYIHDEDADRHNNPCIKNGAKKAIWKCVPRNYRDVLSVTSGVQRQPRPLNLCSCVEMLPYGQYSTRYTTEAVGVSQGIFLAIPDYVFDGHEEDNIRWMNNDIAIVKTEDEFDFTRRIRGCEFIPRPVCYNNQSQTLEEADGQGTIAGWGSTAKYNEPSRESKKQQLLETRVRIISKSTCKKRWGKRYHNIIDNYMICTADVAAVLSEICSEKYVDCTDIDYDGSEESRRRVYDPEKLQLHSAYHNSTGLRKQGTFLHGGFCENDHGGPLIYGADSNAIVIGVISACLVKEGSDRCYGPFLYTSVWKNRILINCAIYKDHTGGCNKLFRAGGGTHIEETISWVDHPDGPAKNELKTATEKKKQDETKRRQYDDSDNLTKGTTLTTKRDTLILDTALEHSGVVLRSHDGTSLASTTLTTRMN